jgi:hypothetical protein
MSTTEQEIPTHVVHVHHFFHGDPGVSTAAFATAHATAGNGSTAYAPPTPPGPAPGYRWSRFHGFYIEEPGEGPWLWLLLAVIATLAIFGLVALGQWIFGGDSKPAATPPAKPALVTMPKLLASEHFAVNRHAVCSYVSVANGTAYKLYLNRGGACRHTVQTIVPATKVSGFKSKYVRRASVTFVYDNTKLSPAAARHIKKLALGEQVLRHLRYIVARENK